MLSNFLIRNFVKNYNNIDSDKVRESYGYLGGIVGILINIILFVIKLIVGFISHSISVTADAFNSLSDATSSIITILGFKLASKPADKEHPFGHGRIEYLSGLIVSFMIMIVGLEFIKSSYTRIMNPTKIDFQWIEFTLILLSIIIKLWISKFNKLIAKSINSSALQASSLDALGDVFTSSSVALSLILSKYTTFPADGYIGLLVSLFILYSGYSLTKKTLDPLLGEAPDPKLVEKIINEVTNYKYIISAHELIIHDYGPRRAMASIHADVPFDISLIEIHKIINKAQQEISKKLNIYLVIQIDPIDESTPFGRHV